MTAMIRTMHGVGPQVVDIFESAGFFTITSLKHFNAKSRIDELWAVINERKKSSAGIFQDSYWKRLYTRCINIIYRAKSEEATDFVPAEYMCPITLEWFHDPVVAASGISYSREAIEEHLERNSLCPVTRIDLTDSALYDNITLRKAVEQYRLHHKRFRSLS